MRSPLVTDVFVEAGGSGSTRSDRINDVNVQYYEEVKHTDVKRSGDRRFC